MYYLKNFLLYSILGFAMESTLYKISNRPKHSGIFYGPMTAVYGVGIVAILLIDKYFYTKLKTKPFIKYLIEFLTLTIILSLIECIGGNILNLLFNIDLWNYSKEAYNLGKYLCLKNSIIWGIMGVLYLNVFKKFTDKILKTITKKETYIILTIFIIDLFLVLTTKIK